jgi:hypothetical protein
MEMTVTRNFYDARSVTAFLLYAIQTGDTKGARQAAAELMDSGLKDVVDDAATLLLLLAPPQYGFLPKEERWKAALSLPPFVLPTPLRRLPLPTQANTKAKATTCPWNPVKTEKGTGPTIWGAVDDALKRGRVERAATLSLVVAEEDRASLLESFGKDARWLSLRPLDRAFVQAYAGKAETAETAFALSRSTRSFTLPVQALSLWNVASPPLSLCAGAPTWVLDANASPFWKDLVKKHGIDEQLNGRTDEAIEAFYTEGFPNDVPDEWSDKERSKSHGLCVRFEENPWASFFPITRGL